VGRCDAMNRRKPTQFHFGTRTRRQGPGK